MMKGNNPQGLGNDIVEIARIHQSIERHGQHFLDKLFTPREQEYCLRYKDTAPHFAGRFAAKEAIAKALGTGIGEALSWLDIEILPDPHGRPIVTLSSRAQTQFDSPNILLSISHSKEYAIATALFYTSRNK